LLLGAPGLKLLRLENLGLPLRVELLGFQLGLHLLRLLELHLVLLRLHRHLALVGLELLSVVPARHRHVLRPARHLRPHPAAAVSATLTERFAAERYQRSEGQNSRNLRHDTFSTLI
jgi:hypothetical protein